MLTAALCLLRLILGIKVTAGKGWWRVVRGEVQGICEGVPSAGGLWGVWALVGAVGGWGLGGARWRACTGWGSDAVRSGPAGRDFG